MTHDDGHDHEAHEHDGHEHDGHEHVHTFDWQGELEAMRQAAKHYYEHQFDWKGQAPPPGFEGPRFYPASTDWRLTARLDRTAPGAGDHVTLATSTGQLREMAIAGDLVFDAAGSEHRLAAFISHDPEGYETLFVPFRDATSGTETYGAGRYVDIPYDDESDEVELDFNFAYNPSCVFSAAYDCPYPPPRNRLEIPVRAGEMLPVDTPPAS
jgi:uncharacterized protein (DUF1684 family)